MENLGETEKDNSFIVFITLFDLYLFEKKIENINTELMLNEEYYLINLDWIKNLKNKYNFKNLENILNEHFNYDNTNELQLLSKKDKLFPFYKILKEKFGYNIKVSETDFKSIKIIQNKDIEKIEKNYVAQRNFAFISPNIMNNLQTNGFIIDIPPKREVFIGNHNVIFENMHKDFKNCLQCIIYKNYDSFTNEYIIKFKDKESLNENKKLIISKGLNYFFDEKKIRMNDYMEQYLYNFQKKEIAIVYNLNKENLIESKNMVEQTMSLYNSNNLYYQNNYQFKKINENEKNNIIPKNFSNNNNNINNDIINNGTHNNKIYFNYLDGKVVNFSKQKISVSNTYLGPKFLDNFQIIDHGLKNFRNSCYINAVLQCLIHTNQIARYFLRNNDNFNQFQTPISFLFNLLIKNFYFPKNEAINNNNNNLTENLFLLCRVVNIMNPNFSPWSPNDAKDFLIFFIGKLHEELNVKMDKPFNIINQNDPLRNFISYFTINYNSIISNIFNWTNQTKRKCSNCSSQIFSYQTFPYLILDLEKTRKKNFMNDLDEFHKSKIGNEIWQSEYYQKRENIPITLLDCIKYYTSYENKINFLCPLCNQQCIQTTINSIYTSPNIFIFILNRGKNNIFSVKMTYPNELDLSNFIQSVGCPTKYELTGVITHLGVSGPNGHFMAFCKNPINRKWYKYNDDSVTEANIYNVHNEGIAYILFYNLIQK